MPLPDRYPQLDTTHSRPAGEFTWPEYEREYHAILERRRPHRDLDLSDLDGGCLLCAEPTADQCHRRLAAEYLQQVWPGLTITHL